MIDLLDVGVRRALIQEIEAPENRQRKSVSLKQYEIFNDRIHQYVLEHLRGQFSENTVKEMPIISALNIARRIVKQEASIYREEPKRRFENVPDDVADKIVTAYDDEGWNDKFGTANEYFKLQQQCHLQWTLKNGKLKPRILLGHQIDAIPDPEDPENALGYIISIFDKTLYLNDTRTTPTGYISPSHAIGVDGFNKMIADRNDWKEKNKRYVVWTKDLNFIMDSKGVIVSEDTKNELGLIPIIDISSSKDFEYWVRQSEALSEFTIQFNAAFSDVANVVRLQGWGQAVFSGPANMMPETLQVGPNHVIRLPIDPNNPVPASFQYVTPNADIAGSLDYMKMLLSTFLSSRGIDPKAVSMDSSGESFSSGLERLLSMISKFEASRDDIDIFRRVESESFEIIKAFEAVYGGTEFYPEPFGLTEDAVLLVEFKEPEMIQSEKEELDLIQQKIEMGMISKLRAYMEVNDVSEETALKELDEIENEGKSSEPQPPPMMMPGQVPPNQNQPQSQPEEPEQPDDETDAQNPPEPGDEE